MDSDVLTVLALMKEQGKTKADLGRLLGLDSSQVTRITKGARRVQRHEMDKIQEWLGQAARPGMTGVVVPLPHMVPLYGWVGAASQGRLTLAEQDLRGYVAMHPGQQHVRDAFALEVADISMSPRYEPGEVVYLAPNRWPSRDQDCVVVTIEDEGLLKRYVSRDAEEITLRQLNPPADIKVKLANISSIHTVVGRG